MTDNPRCTWRPNLCAQASSFRQRVQANNAVSRRAGLIFVRLAEAKFTLLVLVLVAVYGAGIWGVVTARIGDSYASSGPTFRTFSADEDNQYVLPPPETTSYILYYPKAFDPDKKQLTLQVGLRPSLYLGETTGSSWQIFGYDVLLQMAGARVAAEPNSSQVIFQGSRDSVTLDLAERLAEEQNQPDVADWGQEIATDRLTVLATPQLYAPFDVILDVETYGRGFFFRDDIFWYPFDSYGFTFNLAAWGQPWFNLDSLQFQEALEPWRIVPVHFVLERGNVPGRRWSTDVENWSVLSRPAGWLGVGYADDPDEVASSNASGRGGLALMAQRPLSVRLLVLLFSLIYVASVLALSIVVTQIAKIRRPPTGNILVWAAALVFASVSLRSGLPSNVPYGVLFDWIFFFPTLIVSILSTLYLALNWVKRADYIP
jgi:hypothetical protein